MKRNAVELDPLSPTNYSDLVFLYMIMHRQDLALTNARVAAELSPQCAEQQDALIVALITGGDLDAADKMINRVSAELKANADDVSRWRSLYYYYSGDRTKLRKSLDLQLQQATQSDVRHAYMINAFFTLAVDGVDHALPLLEKSWQTKELLLTSPLYVYLPERISTNPEWLEFWGRPGLKETMDMRRQFGPYETIGYWKGSLK